MSLYKLISGFLTRFLTGDVSHGGVYCSGLRDTWSIVNADGLDPGYTFSALNGPRHLVKRVRELRVKFF